MALPASKAEDPVGFHREASEVWRGDEAGVEAFQRLLGDPTGLGAAASNVDLDALVAAAGEQVAKRWNTDSTHATGDLLLQQLRSIAGQRHAHLHSGRRGTVHGDVEGDRSEERRVG